MMSRKALCGAILGALMLLSCGQTEPTREELLEEMDDLASQLQDAQDQLGEAQGEVDRVRMASDDLLGAVSQFDDTNWREVVPQVRDASEERESAAADAEAAVDY